MNRFIRGWSCPAWESLTATHLNPAHANMDPLAYAYCSLSLSADTCIPERDDSVPLSKARLTGEDCAAQTFRHSVANAHSPVSSRSSATVQARS
jgi:hypothetical protein